MNETSQQALEGNEVIARPAEDVPLAIAQRYGSFSGFYCKEGHLVLGVTSLATQSDIDEIADVLYADNIPFYCRNREFPGREPEIVHTRQRYSFLQLRSWRNAIFPMFYNVPGALGIGIDYERNQVLLDVEGGTEATHRDAIQAMVPEDAVQISASSELELAACSPNFYGSTPRACLRPVPGGAQLSFNAGAYGTFTVAGSRYSQRGWVTCAHCVGITSIGQNLGTDVYQPDESDVAHFAGEEAFDPPRFPCTGQYGHFYSNCRYSDSAWVREYGAPPHTGQIVRTSASNGSVTECDTSGPACVLSSSNPRFQVYGTKAVVQGMQVDKVGRTSGWTTGIVGTTCQDRYEPDSGTLYLCQVNTTTPVYGGDSGSPAFFWWSSNGVNTVELVGVMWAVYGSTTVLSPWANVALDLGAIDVRYQPTWKPFTTQKANDIGVAVNGAVWVTTTTAVTYGYTIKRYNGMGGWDTIPGDAVRIAVDPVGNAWVVNNAGNIWKWSGSAWQTRAGSASDIAIGANGAVWKIGTTVAGYGYDIGRWNGAGWTTYAGAAVRIAVDPAGNPWVVASDYTIWRLVGGVFQQVPGAATDIGIGSDGMVWIVGTAAATGGREIFWWSGVDWVLAQGGAEAISVHKGAQPFVVDSAHDILWAP